MVLIFHAELASNPAPFGCWLFLAVSNEKGGSNWHKELKVMIKNGERFLREKEVCHMIGVSRSTIWRWEKAGKFPSRHLLYGSIAIWKYSEVAAWCESITSIAA